MLAFSTSMEPPATYPAGETVLVVTRSARPTRHTSRQASESRLLCIDFTLDLELAIKGAVLTICDGKIWAVSLGSSAAARDANVCGIGGQPCRRPGGLQCA